ncbi:putative cyanobacterial phytochrome B [Amylocarpus encephaloides]|uniref:Cyanobacterial phytochrome B n=1 Tax=Amylocarpus encephaloides TaxID=45428 RepID=A0A9P7Y9H4_9HELO|nr:putative cyanobacterial phytochrome B [Amylocarpus encephaloides]
MGNEGADSTGDINEAGLSDGPVRVNIPPRNLDLGESSDTLSKDTADKKGRPQICPADSQSTIAPSVDGKSTWSVSSNKHLASEDRVFPIRSVVSVDPTRTSAILSGQRSEDQHGSIRSHSVPLASVGVDIALGLASGRRQSHSTFAADDHRKTSRSTPHDGLVTSPPREDDLKAAERRSKIDADRRVPLLHIYNDAGSENSYSRSRAGSGRGTLESDGPRMSREENDLPGLITARFKHIVTAEGHAVITGRDGETLQRCEDEPIHIPGAVQGFGLLVEFKEEEDGNLVVRVVSENSKTIIGYTPQDLFKLKSFTDILSEEQADNLLDHVDFIRDDEADPANNGPEVFTISVKSPSRSRKNQKLWCGMHVHPSYPDLVVCEFEIDEDPIFPLVPDEDIPSSPEDTLHSNPTREEYSESTSIGSKPLRVLRNARKRRGEEAAMQVFNIMSQVQEQLANAPNLETFLKILVGVVKELTGFHRVMIYQFDGDFNGRVVTELVDPRATKDLYKGLHFPASDIPKQARDLYQVNKVRLLYDRDLETARLVCRSTEDLEQPLDLSFSYLRAMSPIHIKYLANMAVRSSMSISINAFNDLWGLIACHTYGPRGMRVSFPIRKLCRLVGDMASRSIEHLSYASRLQARKLINMVPTEANPSGYIIASSEDLLRLFDAEFGLLSIHGETKIMGRLEQSQEALAILEYLRLKKITSVTISQDINTDFPDLRYPLGFNVIAGLLLVPLSVGGADFIVFLRKGQNKEVKWAGNPYEKFIKEGTESYLEPRKSFKTWSETVVGKCREWKEEQVETAAVLCLVYGKFIEVWRQKEAALQGSQLTRLLLANSAHEVRTPLNAIINYLEIALEGALDQETRENLAKSHSASKSLIYVINDLLDLTKTEEGQELIKYEVFDLPATIREAADSFVGDAKRKGLDYQVIEHPRVPQFVFGDQRRVWQAVSNLTANAIQHTTFGWVRIEMWAQDIVDGKVNIEIILQDSGAGMSNEKLDSLFQDLEQVTSDGMSVDGSEDVNPGQALHPTKDTKGRRTLGLGLAMVARIVRNMDGQLRLKSAEGKGSRFVLQLPFIIPEDGSPALGEKPVTSSMSNLQLQNSLTTPPPGADGEVTLVAKASSIKADNRVQTHYVGDFSSVHSFKSGSSAKSDVDRLIDAISSPIAGGEPKSPTGAQQQPSSKGSIRSRKSAGSIEASNRGGATNDMPGRLTRSQSYGTPEHLHGNTEGPNCSEFVTDNKTLLRAARMPDEFVQEEKPQLSTSSVLFDIPDNSPKVAPQTSKSLDANHLQILVAEDDPVNSKIIMKRLGKSGHNVHHTVNGEDCASVYCNKSTFFDVVLMDVQMPIIDGLASTKMIRSFEKSQPSSNLAPRGSLSGRVPIFAVSASLVERERQIYIDAGFDGWVLKPIDFRRLNTLLQGIVDDDTRSSCLYKPGQWERGGWFHKRRLQATEANTQPSNKSPVQPSRSSSETLQPNAYSPGSNN